MNSLFPYFFSSNPGTQMKYYISLVVVIALIFIASIVISQIYKKKKRTDFAFKKYFKNTSKVFGLLAILLAFLVLTRYETIPYFAMRIWLYITLLTIVYFIYKYIKIYKTSYIKDFEHSKKQKKVNVDSKYSTKK